MRKKVAGGVGLVVVVIVSLMLAACWMTPAEPLVRVGMTARQVDEVLGFGPSSEDGDDGDGEGTGCGSRSRSSDGSETAEAGSDAPISYRTHTIRLRITTITSQDWLGNNRKVTIHYDKGLVTSVETESLPRTCPPWLGQAMNAVGW